MLTPDSLVFAAGDEKYSGVFNYGGFEENKVWTKKNILRIVKVSIVEPGAAESNYALQVERKASSVSPATFITTSKDGAFDEWNTDVKYCLSFALLYIQNTFAKDNLLFLVLLRERPLW